MLLYMVCHGSHQEKNIFLLALIYSMDPSWDRNIAIYSDGIAIIYIYIHPICSMYGIFTYKTGLLCSGKCR